MIGGKFYVDDVLRRTDVFYLIGGLGITTVVSNDVVIGGIYVFFYKFYLFLDDDWIIVGYGCDVSAMRVSTIMVDVEDGSGRLHQENALQEADKCLVDNVKHFIEVLGIVLWILGREIGDTCYIFFA